MSTNDEFAYDFFVSRRGSAGEIASEVAAVLEAEGHRVKVQDHDFGRGGDFVGDIHDALISARHLFVLHTADYDQNYWTRKEFTNFLACLPESRGARRICMLRCDESMPRGILANVVFGDLVGVEDKEERRKIILAAARGEPLRLRREPPLFGGAMPRPNSNFIGRKAVLSSVEKLVKDEIGSPAVIVIALCGMPGTGKTSIARACVDLLAPEYAGVWWIKGEKRESVVSGLAALVARLGAQRVGGPDSDRDAETAARAAVARIERFERPMLLVFDNVDEPRLLDEFLPTRGAHVLITSRRSDWHGQAREVVVDVMGEDEAVAFLQSVPAAGTRPAPAVSPTHLDCCRSRWITPAHTCGSPCRASTRMRRAWTSCWRRLRRMPLTLPAWRRRFVGHR